VKKLAARLKSAAGPTAIHGSRGEVWRIILAGFPIKLAQTGKDRFVVTYGKQVHLQGDYHKAAADIGFSIMHALACEGKIDDVEN
jgi:hypothetical protein